MRLNANADPYHELDKIQAVKHMSARNLASRTELAMKLTPRTELAMKLTSKTELAMKLASRTELAIKLTSRTKLAIKLASRLESAMKLATRTELAIKLTTTTEMAIKLTSTADKFLGEAGRSVVCFMANAHQQEGQFQHTTIDQELDGQDTDESKTGPIKIHNCNVCYSLLIDCS